LGVGKRVSWQRLRSGKTQKQLARSANIAVTYLSRLENEHVSPSVRTLSKIADALNVPITAFFNGAPDSQDGDGCPVSLSGRCILDESFVGRAVRPSIKTSYSGLQLEMLKLCNILLHSGDQEMFAKILATMKSLQAQLDSRTTGKQA